MCIDKPKTSPIISVTFHIASSQNRSYKFSRSIAFILSLAVRQYLITLFGVYDKCVIESCLNTVVDLNIPILQWSSHSLNLSFDTLLNRREYHPRIRGNEVAHHTLLLHKIAQIIQAIRILYRTSSCVKNICCFLR